MNMPTPTALALRHAAAEYRTDLWGVQRGVCRQWGKGGNSNNRGVGGGAMRDGRRRWPPPVSVCYDKERRPLEGARLPPLTAAGIDLLTGSVEEWQRGLLQLPYK